MVMGGKESAQGCLPKRLLGRPDIKTSAKKWRLKGDDPKFYKTLESDPECFYVQDWSKIAMW